MRNYYLRFAVAMAMDCYPSKLTIMKGKWGSRSAESVEKANSIYR